MSIIELVFVCWVFLLVGLGLTLYGYRWERKHPGRRFTP